MNGNIKIIDFGFSCLVNDSGKVYSTVGSPINMDPTLLKKYISNRKKRKLGYDQNSDIWSIGTICYEMLIGKPVFDTNDLIDLVEKVENGDYVVPTNLSHEVVSFINGMLQYDSQKRLSCAELSEHPFLKKAVKDFQRIELEKVSKKVNKSGLHINTVENKSIWSIFNANDENKLVKISRKNALKKEVIDDFEANELMLPPESGPDEEKKEDENDSKEKQEQKNQKDN